MTDNQETVDLSASSADIDISTSTMLKSRHSMDETTLTGKTAEEESSSIVAGTDALNRSKKIALFVLALVAAGASLLTYFLTSSAEYDSFLKQVSNTLAKKFELRRSSLTSIFFTPISRRQIRWRFRRTWA